MTRNAAMRASRPNFGQAVSEWEDDREWLRTTLASTAQGLSPRWSGFLWWRLVFLMPPGAALPITLDRFARALKELENALRHLWAGSKSILALSGLTGVRAVRTRVQRWRK